MLGLSIVQKIGFVLFAVIFIYSIASCNMSNRKALNVKKIAGGIEDESTKTEKVKGDVSADVLPVKLSISKGNKTFDTVNWVTVGNKRGVVLSTQANGNDPNNHYKAVKTYNGLIGDEIFSSLMKFEAYPKIFPKTMVYKKVGSLGKNKMIVYCQAYFKPFQNRDYYNILEYSKKTGNGEKEWKIEWFPFFGSSSKYPEVKKFLRVRDISGRWMIVEKENKTMVSIELFNNFKLPVSKTMALPFEKGSAYDMINQVVSYSTKK